MFYIVPVRKLLTSSCQEQVIRIFTEINILYPEKLRRIFMNEIINTVGRWAGEGGYLAIGTSSGDIQLWDVECMRKLRTLSGDD